MITTRPDGTKVSMRAHERALELLPELDEDSRAYGTFDYVARCGEKRTNFWQAFDRLSPVWEDKVALLAYLTGTDEGKAIWNLS